jgi:calcineurin-like phosphoesterase family protein
MDILFTSDTFFGRDLTAKERGFSSSDEMDELYIENWNKRVKKGDVVYHLGNFAWDPISTETVMSRLVGRIVFVPGPYDSHLPEMALIKLGRHAIIHNQLGMIKDPQTVISHWPLLDWPGRGDGIFHVHGGVIDSDISNGIRFCANVHKWNGAPIELEFLKELIQ